MAIHRFKYVGPDNEYLQRECNSNQVTVNSPIISQTMDVECPDNLLTALQGVMKWPNHFDYVGLATTPNLRFGSARYYRNASLTVNSSLTHLSLDATSSLLTPVGFSLSSGNLVPAVSGIMRLSAHAQTDGALIAGTGLRMKITRDPSGVADVVHDATHWAAAGQPPASQCDIMCSVTANVPFKIELALSGAVSDPLITGDSVAYVCALLISL